MELRSPLRSSAGCSRKGSCSPSHAPTRKPRAFISSIPSFHSRPLHPRSETTTVQRQNPRASCPGVFFASEILTCSRRQRELQLGVRGVVPVDEARSTDRLVAGG